MSNQDEMPSLRDWPWWRIAESSGLAVLALTFVIRLIAARDDFFEDDGQPLLMLLLLVCPALSLVFMRPFTCSRLSRQQVFGLAALHAFAIVMWWVAFGPEWFEYRADWESRFTWILVVALPAIAWYQYLGWSSQSPRRLPSEVSPDEVR